MAPSSRASQNSRSFARGFARGAFEILGRPTLVSLSLLWLGFFLLPTLSLGPVSLSFWQALRAGVDNPFTLNRFDLGFPVMAAVGLVCVLSPLGMLVRRFRNAHWLRALPLVFLGGLGLKFAWHLFQTSPAKLASEGALGHAVPLFGGAREAEALSVLFAAPQAGRSAALALFTEGLSIGFWVVVGSSLALFALALLSNPHPAERSVRRQVLALTSRYERGALPALLALWVGSFALPVFRFEALANFTFWELLRLDFEGPFLNVSRAGFGPVAGLGLLSLLAPAFAPFLGVRGKWLNVVPLMFLVLFALGLALVLSRSSLELEQGPLGQAVSAAVRQAVWSTGKERIAFGFLPLLLSTLFLAYLALFRRPMRPPTEPLRQAPGTPAQLNDEPIKDRLGV